MALETSHDRCSEMTYTAEAARRAAREKRTVGAMMAIYCKGHHGQRGGSICDECAAILDYAKERIDSCPLIEDKPTCANCPVHCYDEPMREKIKGVMRYSGPRMMLSHPVMSVRHMADSRRSRVIAKSRA